MDAKQPEDCDGPAAGVPDATPLKIRHRTRPPTLIPSGTPPLGAATSDPERRTYNTGSLDDAEQKAERAALTSASPAHSNTAHDGPKSRDYVTGFGKPPKSGQFKPGKSGNPKGRPKGTKNLQTDLREEIQEKIVVTEGGSRRPISKQRALLKRMTAEALQGNSRSMALLVNLILRVLSAGEQANSDSTLSADDQAILKSFEDRIRRQHGASGSNDHE